MVEQLSAKKAIRYNKILQTALDLFCEKGYEKTSLSEIVAQSGGSLSTIYEYFGDKDGLFYTILEREISDFNKSLQAAISITHEPNLRDFLVKFGQIFINKIFDKRTFALYKIAFSESFRNGEKVAKFFRKFGVELIHNKLANFLREQEALNTNSGAKFKTQNFELLSSSFLSMINPEFEFNAIILQQDLNALREQRLQNINLVADIFLNGIKK